ncbi:MAG: hypothetical protein QF464_02010 [Myxococcota bacterium]|nr:hypothetical protein [Myxococcota bacterium]
MDDPHPAHRFLVEPDWASGSRPTRHVGQGLDLSDLEGRIAPADVVRRAARNVNPLSFARPSAWMLREAISKAHGLEVSQVFPRASLAQLLAPIMGAFVGPGDHVALAAPCRPEFIRQVLRVGARYVDIGRDHAWSVQAESFERLLSDGGLRAAILGRPDLPTGTLTPLIAVRQALHAGVLVIVDETALAYADPSAGLPRSTTPKSDTALTLFEDESTPTQGLVVVRRVPGLGAAQLVYAVAEPESVRRMWRIDPVAYISAPVAAGAWIALDHTAHARRIIVERCTTRAELRTGIRGIDGYEVSATAGPSLLVQRPGISGSSLREALAQAGLIVAGSEHHAWRDGVAFGIPLAAALDRVVTSFQSAAEALATG